MKAGRSKMLLVGALFIAPPLAAVLLYFGAPQWIPSATTNYGQLVVPSRPLPALHLVDAAGSAAPALGDKWSLVYLAGDACDTPCQERLYLIRQVRRALDKDSLRVQRVYIAPDSAALQSARAQLAAEHHDLLMYADAGAPGARAADFFKPLDAQAIYVVDPVGNWMMIYSGALEPKGIFRDLKRLLRTSHIG